MLDCLNSDILVLVISVKSFAERHAAVKKQADQFGLDIEFIWNYDPTDSDMESSRTVSDMSLNSASCVSKHVHAQKLLLRSEKKYCLVLEDDVLLLPDFVDGFKAVLEQVETLPEGWLIFLGGADNRLPNFWWNASSVYELLPGPLTTAEAYLIDRRSAELRISWINDNQIHLPADHFLAWLDPKLGNVQYRILRAIAGQGSVTGLVKTSLDSNRARHGRFYLITRYRWNRFRKQIFPIGILRVFLFLKCWLCR